MATSCSTLEMLKHNCSTACGRGAGLMRRFSADRAGAVVLLFGLTLVSFLVLLVAPSITPMPTGIVPRFKTP